MASGFSPSVLELLRKAGWFEGREVPISLPVELQPFATARRVLIEFGGLHIGYCGAGVDCATSDVEIDPTLAMHVLPELRAYERSINRRLFPLGEVHLGHGFLIIDELGRTYLLSDELSPLAPMFAECLELLLLGLKRQN
jgi:hypothetical protein